MCYYGFGWQYFSIGLGKGLLVHRQEVIKSTNRMTQFSDIDIAHT